MRRALAIALMVGVTATAQSPRLHLPPLDAVLPMRAETIYGAVRAHVDPEVAMNVVDAMAPSWRLAGNPSYDGSIDMIGKWLQGAGFVRHDRATTVAGPATWVESYRGSGQGWAHDRGTLSIDQTPRVVVLSREQDRVALCINSFSTSPGGVVLPLIDVGAGTDRDFAGTDVKGAVVLGDAAVGGLWSRAPFITRSRRG